MSNKSSIFGVEENKYVRTKRSQRAGDWLEAGTLALRNGSWSRERNDDLSYALRLFPVNGTEGIVMASTIRMRYE